MIFFLGLKNLLVFIADKNIVSQYKYDKNDRLLKEALTGAELERSYAYTYDYRGNLVTERDSEGIQQEKHLYRTDGKLMHSQFADGNELEYSYGINGLQQEIRTARSQQADRAAQVYTYDARGRITGIQDGNQNQTGYHMDPWGRVHQIETAEGGKENFTYDYAGHVTSTTDANGGVITYRYNSQGKVCEIIDQEGNSETFRYDREGRRIFHEDRIGNQVRTTYNVDGRPVLERACDHMGENEVSRSWEYDGIGNVKKAVAGGFCYTYEYRPDGKLIKKSSSGRTLISCTYHADKSLKSLTDVSGKTVHYGYDSLGRLERICDDNGDEIVRYGHTAGGKLKEIRHGNGMHTAYEYDTDDNIIRLTLKNEKGIVFSDFRYEYDLNGNRILKSGSCLLPVEDKIKEQVVRYQYDCMDRLMEEQYDGKPVKYIYDRCGNRLVKVDSDGKEEYNYNRKNQLISRKKGTESVEYRYDLQGNILEEASNRGRTEYGYNAFNQQTTTFMHNGQIQENWYDAEFLRAEVSENGCSSRFLYYNGELLAESEPDETVISRYILGYGVSFLLLLTGFVVSAIANHFHGVAMEQGEWMLTCETGILIVALILILLIPVQLKFGVDNGRIVMAAVFGGSFGLAYLTAKVMQNFGVDLDQLLYEVQNLGIGMITLIIVVFLGLTSYISCRISIHIMERKEF